MSTLLVLYIMAKSLDVFLPLLAELWPKTFYFIFLYFILLYFTVLVLVQLQVLFFFFILTVFLSFRMFFVSDIHFAFESFWKITFLKQLTLGFWLSQPWALPSSSSSSNLSKPKPNRIISIPASSPISMSVVIFTTLWCS